MIADMKNPGEAIEKLSDTIGTLSWQHAKLLYRNQQLSHILYKQTLEYIIKENSSFITAAAGPKYLEINMIKKYDQTLWKKRESSGSYQSLMC